MSRRDGLVLALGFLVGFVGTGGAAGWFLKSQFDRFERAPLTFTEQRVPHQQPGPALAPPPVPKVVSGEKPRPARVEVQLRQSDERAVYRVQGRPVPADQLETAIRQLVSQGRTDLVLETEPNVPHSVIVALFDRARAAGVRSIHLINTNE
jgi:hypothetical protein